MFINKAPDGKNNICGRKISRLRMEMGLSQNKLAAKFQLVGFKIGKNGVQAIEDGSRHVTDIELGYISRFFGIDVSELITPDEPM